MVVAKVAPINTKAARPAYKWLASQHKAATSNSKTQQQHDNNTTQPQPPTALTDNIRLGHPMRAEQHMQPLPHLLLAVLRDFLDHQLRHRLHIAWALEPGGHYGVHHLVVSPGLRVLRENLFQQLHCKKINNNYNESK